MKGAPAEALRGGLGGSARILLVTDQPVLADLIKLTLNRGAFFVRSTPTLAAAVTSLERSVPHLVVLDMDVEGAGAEGVLERLGSHPSRSAHAPIIALTQRGDLMTKLAAFDRGVDDILTVPFSPEEFLARTLAVLRRSYREAVTFAPVVRVGRVEIDISRRRVLIGEVSLELTPLEQTLLYQQTLLYLLAANTGRVLTRDEIMDHLWGADYVPDSNVVDRHVRNLRTKLGDDWRRPRFIATVPGRGYRFLPPEVETHGVGAGPTGVAHEDRS